MSTTVLPFPDDKSALAMVVSTIIHLDTKDGCKIDADGVTRFLDDYPLETTVVFGRSAAYIDIIRPEGGVFPHEEVLKLMRAIRKDFPSLLIDGFASAGIVFL